jgi:multidrug efflux pump subunit AcrA (membrane-fusion protein)
MTTSLRIAGVVVALLLPSLAAQDQEPTVPKETISVHTVQRGNMPLSQRAEGSIVSLQPPKALVTLVDGSAAPCKIGQKASMQIDRPTAFAGEVVAIRPGENDGSPRCEIGIAEALPAKTGLGKKVGALLVTGELRDVVYFGRPADSSPNSEASVFVLEPADHFARRVNVRYGQMSGPMIQILDGLSPGDRVIVTDMSKWKTNPRVRLQ